jgi:hypothetical protein
MVIRNRHNLGRRHVGLAALALVATGLAPAPSASAAAPTFGHVIGQSSGSIDCGTFSDDYVDYYDVSRTTFVDQQGVPTRVVLQVFHTSDDVNSVTGFTVHEFGHLTLTYELATGDLLVSGATAATRPGQGIVIAEIGRIVIDALGNIVSIAGHYEDADADYCAAVS